MKTKLLLIFICLLQGTILQAQDKYFTKSGKVSFYSKTAIQNIEATNNGVSVVLDKNSGNLQFAMLMKGFEFEKALMQEHFNKNYVESDLYPKAEFKGFIINNDLVDYKKNGSYPVKVKGQLKMHGEEKEIEANGILKINNERIEVSSVFRISLEDYKIRIPETIKEKIANELNIEVFCKLLQL